MNVHAIVREAFSIGMVQIESEVMQLAGFLSAIRPHNILEIGTDRGGLFYLLTRLSTGIKISLDLPGGPYSSLPVHAVQERDQRIREWDQSVHLIRNDSHSDSTVEMVREILDEPLDFLFIDGDHSLQGVTEDYRRYSPFVRKGGWIGFHDINDTAEHRNGGVEVADLWAQLSGRTIEFSANSHWAGIGLIQVPEIVRG